LLVVVVARRIWNWRLTNVILAGVLFLGIDLVLLAAVADKIEYGGWFPLALGLALFATMTTWRRGRELVVGEMRRSGLALEPFISSFMMLPPLRVPGTAIFMTANENGVPNALLHNLKHNKVLHERNVILTVEIVETPVAENSERTDLEPIGDGFYRLTMRFGFAEDPNVPNMLETATDAGQPFDMMDTTFFLSRESIVAVDRPGMALWRDK